MALSVPNRKLVLFFQCSSCVTDSCCIQLQSMNCPISPIWSDSPPTSVWLTALHQTPCQACLLLLLAYPSTHISPDSTLSSSSWPSPSMQHVGVFLQLPWSWGWLICHWCHHHHRTNHPWGIIMVSVIYRTVQCLALIFVSLCPRSRPQPWWFDWSCSVAYIRVILSMKTTDCKAKAVRPIKPPSSWTLTSIFLTSSPFLITLSTIHVLSAVPHFSMLHSATVVPTT